MNAGTATDQQRIYPRFSNAEYDRRYHTVREAMRQDNLDAILVSGARGSSEVHYLSNYLAQSPCWLLFPREGVPAVFIHLVHQPCAKAQSIITDVRWYGPAPIPTLADAIRQRNLAKSRIGLVSMRGMAYGHVTELQRLFPKLNSSSSARHWSNPQSQKRGRAGLSPKERISHRFGLRGFGGAP